MREVVGDLWSFRGYLVIPTNLCVRADGLAVMGRGVALEAARRHPGLAAEYGRRLVAGARGIELWRGVGEPLVLLPTKDDWRRPSPLTLIESGVAELAADPRIQGEVFLPLLGCGLGGLRELDVVPVLHRHLQGDRFILVRPPHRPF